MSEQTSYDVSNEELLKRFAEAVARAGASNSGLCFDPAAGYNTIQARYMHGVVLARLDGVKPPYVPGQKVKVTAKNGFLSQSHNPPVLKNGDKYSIERVWYIKKQWYLELKVKSDDYTHLYPANSFELIKKK